MTVTGDSGAIPERLMAESIISRVRVTAAEWVAEACVAVGADGSFHAQLEAPGGSTLLIQALREADACTGQTLEGSAIAIMRVADDTVTDSETLSFSTLGQVGFDDPVRWRATGELRGPAPHVAFELPDGSPDVCLRPMLYLYRLFDGDGGYAGQVNVNVHGPVLTPTGMPIETSHGSEGYYEALELAAGGCVPLPNRVELEDVTAGLEDGWYLPRIAFELLTPDGSFIPDRFLNAPGAGDTTVLFERNTGFGYLPLLAVGQPTTPQLPTTLLNETPSWGAGGTRGVVAIEDAGRFALGSRRSLNSVFVASLRDPLSGRPIRYSLEPFLPTLAYTGFAGALTEPPLLALDPADTGEISISVTDPAGEQRELMTDAPVQPYIAASWFNAYPVELSFSGPAHTLGLTTLDALPVDFDQYGVHSVHVDGVVRTVHGQELSIGGTYEIVVAEPLELSVGTFHGTPLEIGDAWSPVVVVRPGVPAEIEIEITHYVNGDPQLGSVTTLAGTANRYGYFAAEDTWSPVEHGEYRVDVAATYVDPADGTLWMASQSAASIVATPGSELIGRGEPNTQLAELAGDQVLRKWFFTRTFDPACGEAACDEIAEPLARTVGPYPFFGGDVAWLADLSPITPSVTVYDPGETMAGIAPHLQELAYCLPAGCPTEDVIEQNTYSLRSATAAGAGAHHRPDDVVTWAYWYSSSVRPDVSVFHAASEDHAEHNHWYGHDSYNCQIGLACQAAFTPGPFELGDRNGDEAGDVKLLFGGVVLKSAEEQHFVPYASMAVIVPEATKAADGTWVFGDEKGNRICPPYQGAAGGLGTCGPLLRHGDQEVDLFVTPTGTRPGSILESGDRFVFTGQTWPTLDVLVDVTVTTPSGEVVELSDRASSVGYVDMVDQSFEVTEPGVYEVHVSATQDGPVPSTGISPDPPLVADGRTLQEEYGYGGPLSAVLGTRDSAYQFFVVSDRAPKAITTEIDTFLRPGYVGSLHVKTVSFTQELPAGTDAAWYSLTAPGLIIDKGRVETADRRLTVAISQDWLDENGHENVILGADSLTFSVAYEIGSEWRGNTLNLRGFSALGGPPATRN